MTDTTTLVDVAARAHWEAHRAGRTDIDEWDDLRPGAQYHVREYVLPIVTAVTKVYEQEDQ